jgi:hypothetical protein
VPPPKMKMIASMPSMSILWILRAGLTD